MTHLRQLSLLACLLLAGGSTLAATIVLTPSATTVAVGETFTVTLEVTDLFAGLDPFEEVIAFGFDPFSSDGNVASFVLAGAPAPWELVPALLPVVAATSLPGIPNDGLTSSITLATLTFEALAPGLVTVGVFTDALGNPNHGLFYLIQGPLDLSSTVGVQVVAVPAAVWLFGSALAGLAGFRRQRPQ